MRGATNRDNFIWLLSHGSSLAEFLEWERDWNSCGCRSICCSKCLYRNDPRNYIPNAWWAL